MKLTEAQRQADKTRARLARKIAAEQRSAEREATRATNSLTPADYATPAQMARNLARLKTLPDETAILIPDNEDSSTRRLRAVWDIQGVPRSLQDEILADITAKAQPGAHVGPFVIPDRSAPLAFQRHPERVHESNGFTWADERAADATQAALDEMLEQADAMHAAGGNLPLFCL